MTFLFVALAIYLWTQKRFAQCIALFAIAGLTKEVALLFVFAFIAHYALERKWTVAAKMGLAIVPFVLWQLVLFIWLGKPGFSSGQPLEFPLWGWLSGFVERPGTSILLSIVLVPMSYVPMLLLGAKASMDFLVNRNWHPYALMILVHVGFMLVLPGATAREPAAMLRITQGLVLASLLYGSLIKSSRILNYSILWIGTLAILVNGSVNTVSLPD
jgi:Gpi18-like mannosyltransferase